MPVKPNNDTNASIKIKYGSTKTGLNEEGNKQNVLNIHGKNNLHAIAQGVQSTILDKFPTSILNNLFNEPKTGNLGEMEVTGNFSILQATIAFGTGISKHWFVEIAANIIKTKFSNIQYKDLTATSEIPATITEADWKAFFDDFESNMAKYELVVPKGCTSSLTKELEIIGGYAQEYNTRIGKINWSGSIGISIPSSNSPETVLSLGHGLGMAKILSFSLNSCIEPIKNLKFGTNIGIKYPQQMTMDKYHMKTNIAQNGFFILDKGKAGVKHGIILCTSIFTQINYNEQWKFFGAYKYEHQGKTTITPENLTIFNTDIVNSDSILQAWSIRLVNLALEYEKECGKYIRILAVTLDLPLNGKNIFRTNMIGLGAGIKLAW